MGGQAGGAGGLDGGWCSCWRGGSLGEVGGEEAEWLALVGGQRGAVALEVARDAAAGGTRAVAEGLDAALPLQLCRERDTERERERESGSHQVICFKSQQTLKRSQYFKTATHQRLVLNALTVLLCIFFYQIGSILLCFRMSIVRLRM